jgi:hypothetical protein
VIKVGDYLDLTKKLKEFDFVYPKSLAILPTNLDSAESKKDLVNSDSTSTVRILWRKAGVVETPIEDRNTIPELHQESFEWVGPTIIFAATLIAGNPELVELAIAVISDYLTEWLRGIVKEERKAKLRIVAQTKTGSYRDIHYDGDVEGLKELPKVIRSLNDEQ